MGVEMFVAKEFFVIFPKTIKVLGRVDGQRELVGCRRVAGCQFGWLCGAWGFPVKERRMCCGGSKGQAR